MSVLMPTSTSEATGVTSTLGSKPVVVGIYGVQGSGKTTILNQLRIKLGEDQFAFYDGSAMIEKVVPGGLEAFKKDDDKAKWRKAAIENIRKECSENRKVGIVAGHFMFWPDEDKEGEDVFTEGDRETYSHILYLKVDPKIILQRRLADKTKTRDQATEKHLGRWQQAEICRLLDTCRESSILFSVLKSKDGPSMFNKVIALLRDFQCHSEPFNLSLVERNLDQVVRAAGQLETMMVFDADKTLAAEDTGELFWQKIRAYSKLPDGECPLKAIFKSPLQYTYTAFRQAMLLYEEEFMDETEFEALCRDVAAEVTLHPEFVSLLELAAETKSVGAVLITCGLQRIWKLVIENAGLSETIKVIGGGRLSDGFVVTAEVKRALVTRLQEHYGLYVCAFGDGPLDLPMLKKADRAIVVVGDEKTRSKSMNAALLAAIDEDHLDANQVLLPSNSSPRLDTNKLPVLQLTDPGFLDSVMNRRRPMRVLLPRHNSTTLLLMTPMRDANVTGPFLREAHHRVGWYLANEIVVEAIGVEKFSISHVQGSNTDGYRLLNEEKTTIVALMRGGEPMALGISEAFPLARFVHAKDPQDLKLHHLEGQHTLILVDSVINSGRTIVDFVEHISELQPNLRIVVVAGVVQADAVLESSEMARVLKGQTLVALRKSDNKYKGTKGVDTGNRLFNTTHLA